MAVEIERKFLVADVSATAEWRNAPGVAYRQGYLNRDKTRTVRVRIAGIDILCSRPLTEAHGHGIAVTRARVVLSVGNGCARGHVT